MTITFKTIDYSSKYESREYHEVLLDGEYQFSGCEGIEPEDVMFCRDLPDPFDCDTLLKRVVEHVKGGGDVSFEYITEEEE